MWAGIRQHRHDARQRLGETINVRRHPLVQSILDIVVPGVVLGCIYGLIGMSYAVVYQATRVVNFALGEVMMVIAYLSFTIQSHLGLGFAGLVPLTILVSGAVGLAVEFLVIRPMRGQPIFAIVMSTIGLAIVLRSATAMTWGALPVPVTTDLPASFYPVLGVNLSLPQILVAALLVVASITMTVFLHFTRIGLLVRAAASDESTAQLMGIRVGSIQLLAWLGSAVIAGLTGILLALIQSLGPDLFLVGFKGFPATVLGGLDSAVGSGVGGVIIGVIENFVGRFYGSGLKEVAGLVVIVVVLMVRPSGLFGQRSIERV
jgi:branched-chain amino acid transport system permease protein